MTTLGNFVTQTLEFMFQNVKHFVVNFLNHKPIFSSIFYYLANHKKLVDFTWQQGQNVASSPRFLYVTIMTYLSLTFFFTYAVKTPPLKRTILKKISAIHSLVLVLVSALMVAGSFLSVVFHSRNVDDIVCYPKGTKPTGPAFFWVYVFYLSKIYEYVDTLIIILSKSTRRLSFLHIYHHATVPVMCYFALESAQSLFPGVLFVNALVHVVMYWYYFLCAIGFRPKWKKIVTDCQIFQFVLSFAIMAWIFYYHFTSDGCSGIVAWGFDAVFISTLLGLFLDFRYKNYREFKDDKSVKNA